LPILTLPAAGVLSRVGAEFAEHLVCWRPVTREQYVLSVVGETSARGQHQNKKPCTEV